MARFEYGDSVKGMLFQTVHELCDQEIGVSMPERTRQIQWTADAEVFDDVFKLNPVSLKFAPHGRKFLVTAFSVELPSDEIFYASWGNKWKEGLLENDPFTIGVLQTMQKLVRHPHEECKERTVRYQLLKGTKARSAYVS